MTDTTESKETEVMEEKQETISLLSETREGSRVEVISLLSNGRRAQRLAELGLTPGTPVRILRSAKDQPILISVRGTYLAIDRATASLARVQVLDTVRQRRRWGRWLSRVRRGTQRRNSDPA